MSWRDGFRKKGKTSPSWVGCGEGKGRGGVPKKTRYFDPKTCSQCIVVVAPYPSSLGGVYQPVRTQRETPLPMDPYRRVSTEPQPFRYLLTILFMNLHKGFVWLLCSGKIVLVLKKNKKIKITSDVEKSFAMQEELLKQSTKKKNSPSLTVPQFSFIFIWLLPIKWEV